MQPPVIPSGANIQMQVSKWKFHKCKYPRVKYSTASVETNFRRAFRDDFKKKTPRHVIFLLETQSPPSFLEKLGGNSKVPGFQGCVPGSQVPEFQHSSTPPLQRKLKVAAFHGFRVTAVYPFTVPELQRLQVSTVLKIKRVRFQVFTGFQRSSVPAFPLKL